MNLVLSDLLKVLGNSPANLLKLRSLPTEITRQKKGHGSAQKECKLLEIKRDMGRESLKDTRRESR